MVETPDVLSPTVVRPESAALVSWPARLADALVRLYQLTISPALVAINPTCGCRFTPTCSHYAREALQQHGLGAGLMLTIVRLVKCGPWHPGGSDAVPLAPRATPRCHAVSSGSSFDPSSSSPS